VLDNLIEAMVASYLHRAVIILRVPYGIYYDPKKGGNFILKNTITGDKNPGEVTSSLKGKDVRKVKKAMDYFDSEFGIVITMKSDLKVEEKV